MGWLFLLGVSISCRRKDDSDPPDVLLIIVDTLREDRSGKEHMPYVASLASQGVRFHRAYAQVPYTGPSHASILTSTYPSQHGVRDNAQVLGETLSTWPELLAQEGYRTAAFISGYPLLAQFGFHRGFDHYDDRMGGDDVSDPFTYVERKADATTEAASSWLKTHGSSDQSIFLWVHYFDPHSPYIPPPKYAHLDPYNGEVRFVDDCIKELISIWETCRPLRKRILIFLSDHGESLGEHGEMEHGTFLYESTLRIPLIFMGHRIPAGRSVDLACETVDVLPTVLDLLGLPIPDALSGRSLVPVWQGKAETRPVYGETFSSAIRFGWSELRCLIDESWKYISAPEPELYRLDNDPGELVNLIETETSLGAAMKAKLYQHPGTRENRENNASVVLSKEQREAFLALGYFSAGQTPVAEVQPPDQRDPTPQDPKAMLLVLDLVNRAMDEVASGRLENARRSLERALTEDPENFEILRMLGEVHRDLGDLDRSLILFDRSLQALPTHVSARFGKVTVLLRMNRFQEAIENIDLCLELIPENAEFLSVKEDLLSLL